MRSLRQPLLLFAAGALHVAAFAPLAWSPLSFLSLGVLFYCWLKSDVARTAAWQGFFWGVGCFLAGISWVYVSMHDVGGMPAPIAAVLTLIFALFLGLFPALSGWLFGRLRSSPTLSMVLLAATWTLGEWLRGTIATGFPWLAVGYAQAPPSPLAGYASLLGVYGVGFIVALMSAALAQIFILRRAARVPWLILIALPVLGFGLRFVQWTQPQGEPFTVSLLQGNVPQSLKWDPKRLELSLQSYAELARNHPAQLLVLPETAIPLMFGEIHKRYLKTLIGTDQHLLLGAAVAVPSVENPDAYANGAVMLTPDLQASAYFKHHLVPFGEFVPAGFQWFLDLMRIPMSGFTAGPVQQETLRFVDQQIMPNICYEDLFGEELIRNVPRATVLINLSNTAWFGDSLAQPQHLQIAQMRAMETGRMMLRATNTGMTAAIHPDGTLLAVLPPFTRDALSVSAQGYTGLTPYVRYGNYGMGLVLLVIFSVAMRKRQERR